MWGATNLTQLDYGDRISRPFISKTDGVRGKIGWTNTIATQNDLHCSCYKRTGQGVRTKQSPAAISMTSGKGCSTSNAT